MSASSDNTERADLVSCLIGNINAREKLLEMQRGYYTYTPDKEDEVIYKGFSKESARSLIETFEKYINDNKDSIEALRIIYNSENTLITYSMLSDLKDKLSSANSLFTPFHLWSNYKILDDDGVVEEIDKKQNVNALTNLIQLVRFAYGRTAELSSLFTGYLQRFNLYCGQVQRTLSNEQKEIMRQIAVYVVNEGAFTLPELNSFDTDLWRRGITEFGNNPKALSSEIQQLSRFILKVA